MTESSSSSVVRYEFLEPTYAAMPDAGFFGVYKAETTSKIKSVLAEKGCQPILFAGSGVSMRYFEAPTWHDLLRYTVEFIDDDGHEYDYYLQKYNGNTIEIGTVISTRVMKWAWGKGKSKFPSDLYSGLSNGDVFIKYLIANCLSSITPEISKLKKSNVWPEIELLRRARPHAIITTNFDTLLEKIFEGYEPIVGQNVLRYNLNSFGEIFKIHGTVEDIRSIVITANDYENFTEEKKYISSKLLTYFIEHPVFIFGYGFNDPNVSSIVADVGKILADKDGLIPNIFYVEWDKDTESKTSFPSEKLLTFEGKQFRVRSIVTSDFGWIFEALALDPALDSINTKLVRALAARVYKLVREDIPKGTVEVDYKILEGLTNNAPNLPKLLGITPIGNPVHSHLFNLTDVAHQLGLKNWQSADKLIQSITMKTGIDIKKNDNKYHCKVKNASGFIRKYSGAAVNMLREFKEGKEILLKI